MAIKIGPNWISGALTLCAGGAALRWPSAGMVLMVAGAFVLLAGVRVEGWGFSSHWVDRKRIGQVAIGLIVMCVLLGSIWYSTSTASAVHMIIKIENDASSFFPKDVIGGATYAKAKVRYEGPGAVTCSLYLNELQRDGDSKPILSGVSFLLAAEAGGEPGSPDTFTFSNGSEHFFNLAYVAKGANKLSIQSFQYNATYKAPLLAGTYKFKITTQAAHGGSCPTTPAEIWLQYYGSDHMNFLLDRFKQ